MKVVLNRKTTQIVKQWEDACIVTLFAGGLTMVYILPTIWLNVP